MIKIIEYNSSYSKETYDHVMDIKVNELGWKKDATDLFDIEKIYLHRNGNFWIALDDHKVVGTIAIEDMGNNQGYLKRMYIKKEYRGTGMSSELLESLLKHAKSKNFKEVFLATTDNAQRAIAFYEKSGFKRIKFLPQNFEHYNDTVFFKIEL